MEINQIKCPSNYLNGWYMIALMRSSERKFVNRIFGEKISRINLELKLDISYVKHQCFVFLPSKRHVRILYWVCTVVYDN